MLPRKISENLHIAMVILVFFEQFLGTFCLTFLPLVLMCFAKKDAFCLHISIHACLRRETYRYRRDSKLWKNKLYSPKTRLKIAGGGMHPPHPPPDPPLIVVIITN